MQYSHTTPFPDVDQHLLGRRFRYVPHILLAGVALLGMGTHHLLPVAVGLIAVLAFQNRMHDVTSSSIGPSPDSLRAHGEGGSFPGTKIESTATRPMKPKVVDGGSLEHRQNRR
jgi:hypothetical protein